jgi:hypothetical protein
MKRAQRAAHRMIWPILTLLVVFGVIMALFLRPPPEDEPSADMPAAPTTVPEARP